MSKKLLPALLSLFVLIPGCKEIKNEKAIYSVMNEEKQVIEVKAESVEYMINQKYSFTLLMYTEQCSYCEKAKDNYSKVCNEYGFASYQIEMFAGSIEYLSSKLPAYFSTNQTYPSLYILREGQISYKSNVEDVTDYSNFKKMIKSYSIKTNISTVTTIEGCQNYTENHDSFLLFAYDSSKEEQHYLYLKYLFPAAAKSGKYLLIIDKNTADSHFIIYIYGKLSLTPDEPFAVLQMINQDEKKTADSLLKYQSAADEEISNFITSFYEY